MLAQLAVARHVFGGHGLFHPRQTQPIKSPSTAHGLGAVEALVGIGHQLKAGPHRVAHRTQARHVFAHMGAANLDLRALEALRFRLQRLVHQRLGRQMQPAAFGGVERHTRLRPAQQLPQRQTLALRTPVPQGGVHTRQRQTGHGPYSGGMGVKKQVFPDGLDQDRVAADQARGQVVLEQGHDRRATGTNRVGVARGRDAVAAMQREQNRFLRHERLNSVSAQNLGRQVHLPKAHALNGDGGHVGQQGRWKKQAKQDPLTATTTAATHATL